MACGVDCHDRPTARCGTESGLRRQRRRADTRLQALDSLTISCHGGQSQQVTDFPRLNAAEELPRDSHDQTRVGPDPKPGPALEGTIMREATVIQLRVVERSGATVVEFPFSAFGADVLVRARLVHDEHQRRTEIGLGAVESISALRYLSSMPADLPWPRNSVSEGERCRLPAGCIENESDLLVRRLVPAMTIGSVYVPGRGWRRLLERAARFAPYAARYVWVARVPGEATALVRAAEATLWGIGIVEGTDRRVVLEAEPFTRMRWTPASWLFSEMAYGQFLRRQRLQLPLARSNR